MTNNPLIQFVPKVPLSLNEFRVWISEVEDQMNLMNGSYDRHDDADNLTHTFTPGLYTRQLFMPKDTLYVTRVHLHEHPFVISKGDVSVYDGEKIVRLTAPYQGVTKPLTKRLIYTHENTVWTTFHVTDKTTLEEVDVDGVITCSTFEGAIQ
jgi:hypothetical protein